jgi:hypothetical protein
MNTPKSVEGEGSRAPVSTTPKRIQRKRTKGWKMPEGAIYVGRPTKWGNPVKIGDWFDGKRVDRAAAVAWYRAHVTAESAMGRDAVAELRGKDLSCFCPRDQPCHADVLLKLANGGQ